MTEYAARARWAFLAGLSFLLCLSTLLASDGQQSRAQGEQPQPASSLAAAQAALKHGNAEEAAQILSEYLQAHPNDLKARVMLGQADAKAGKNERAEEEFQAVLKVAPDNYIALAALGELYDHAGHPEKAEPLLGRAVKASQGIPQIRLEWATVLARLHEYKKAQSALSDLSAPSDPAEQVQFHRLKASVALGLGNAATAAAEMERVLALKPDDEQVKLATAATPLQSKNWRRAAELSEPIFTKTRNPSVGMMLLEAQLGAHGNFQPTLESLRLAGANSPDEAAIRQQLAEVLVSHEKFADSIEDFQRLVQLDPNRADLLFNLALAQFKAGKLDDALASAEKSKALGDSAELEDLLGDIQEARGDNLEAVKSYQAAVALAPNEEKYRLSLALELLRHKSFDPAKVVLQQADELHPNSWRVQFALGMLEYFEGKEEEATPILMRAAELSPDPSLALKYVGDIQLDRAGGPDANVVSKLCNYADLHPKQATMQYYCGALLFRRDYSAENKGNMPEILRRLKGAASHLPNGASSHCQLGKAYRWLEEWQAALHESEICARLDPESAEAHYRLAQIYHHEGLDERAKQERVLYETTSKRVADENAKRDETMKTFLYTIQKKTPDHK